mmetsp:Transcript_102471/g.182030  ORF Transcript_102471/g.182030 Transcript_102471/m.182030 type:complete len:325 (+) Transcript_102471:76-1050(+)
MTLFLVLCMLLAHCTECWRWPDHDGDAAVSHDGDSAVSTGSVKKKVVKLVVNSNAKYVRNQTWQKLYSSLEATGFTDYDNLILVKGGAKQNKTYIDHSQQGITVLETQFENFDLHGLSALYHNKNDPLVRADVYVYILDTSTVGKKFPQKFANFSKLKFYELARPPPPCSNVCAFGRGVVERYKNNFDKNVSKIDGLSFEWGFAVNGVQQLSAFADNITELLPRVEKGDPVDIYHTGFPRRVFWYPDFDVYKYIFWAHSGDIAGGKVDELFVPSLLGPWLKLLLCFSVLVALALAVLWVKGPSLLTQSRHQQLGKANLERPREP